MVQHPTVCGSRARRPSLLTLLREDLDTVMERDLAVTSRWEAAMYPHIHALWLHRVSRALYRRDRRVAARALSLLARWTTGLDIHPGAEIGRRVFIDHGAAVVIGETARVGDDVTLYHQVTLGAVGLWRDRRRAPGEARHPTIGNRVVVGANSSILGPVVVGDEAVIGAHAVICDNVPAGTHVRGPRSDVPCSTRTWSGASLAEFVEGAFSGVGAAR
jgi:serine O-acetyltransferase